MCEVPGVTFHCQATIVGLRFYKGRAKRESCSSLFLLAFCVHWPLPFQIRAFTAHWQPSLYIPLPRWPYHHHPKALGVSNGAYGLQAALPFDHPFLASYLLGTGPVIHFATAPTISFQPKGIYDLFKRSGQSTAQWEQWNVNEWLSWTLF